MFDLISVPSEFLVIAPFCVSVMVILHISEEVIGSVWDILNVIWGHKY